MFPSLYYNLSNDYSGEYENKSSSKVVEAREGTVVVQQSKNNDGKKGNRRGRGDKDNNIWYGIAASHSSLWGLSTVFFGLSQVGWLRGWYAFYIEHVISNLMVIVYITSMVSLSIDASDTADVQGFLEMLMYAFLFPGAFLFMEM